ncbi:MULTISPECIES: hypothetical protein [Acetobacter]|uniref:Uncharacterized protein n=1 Tax=Acetobacter conturbans TaxID=1737472 RepID=A0ABX0K4M7_9PROT|nr:MULTISPECIES: hypothetical protein [Acetobacter]NHN90210.1 hypothetical protein [Acetobacter conturbans]NHN93713.1 hypothetical protein [Acetobacter sicerae]
MKKSFLPILACGLIASMSAHAAGLHPVKPLPGYTCMMLNLSESQMMDFQHPLMFKAGPSDDAANVAPASGQVAIKTGAEPTDGYLPTINFAFKPVWIEAKYVAPYHAKADPAATCVPVIMSDGKLGFDHPRR